MAILILEPDVNGRARASIEESAARHAEVGRLLAHVNHDVDMPLLQTPQEQEALPCREPVQETTAVSAHFSAQLQALYEQLAAYHARTAASLAEAKLAPIDEEKGVAVEITHPETLPALPFVRKLRILQGSGPLDDDQALAMPDLVAPALQDPLSVGLHALAAQLQELNLRAFVTEHERT
ncbi:hypothetical protein C8A01DRAFT_35620 [Parachaetomium inaequale]|uniref:Uncharacterized protein n=1 Tax=Parachaetomium inaequale TaxID=2588326 RepID=A0AAN6SSE2_9PEZI|nr:hypothetical protein C8A01DRAFT_35620 [Parachaetomium inaequale]